MMKTLLDLRVLALGALIATAACDDAATDPTFDDLDAQDALELAVLEDEGSFDAALTFVGVVGETQVDLGRPDAEARGFRLQAAALFAEARRAHLAGEGRRAIDTARAARRLVARALIASGGLPAVEDLLERLEDAGVTLDDAVVDDPDALRAELEAILDEARTALAAGDSVEAVAWAILGEQRLRLRRGHHFRAFDIGQDRARFEVAVAAASVRLAERLIEAGEVPDAVADVQPTDAAMADVPERRTRWLGLAKRWLSRAEEALANGHFARAVHASGHAQWSALKAVVLPGGITREEIRLLVRVSETLLEEARSAVGDDPGEVQARVLNRAEELRALGVRMIEAGRVRGIAPLWRSASMSAWLVASATVDEAATP
jgi:hypothetical protein